MCRASDGGRSRDLNRVLSVRKSGERQKPKARKNTVVDDDDDDNDEVGICREERCASRNKERQSRPGRVVCAKMGSLSKYDAVEN